MTQRAKATSAGSTQAGGSARGLFRRAFATRAASPGSKGSGALSRRGVGAPVGLLVLLALLVGLFTASSASAYYIPKLVEVTEVEYDSAHAVALASSDEFINGWAFEVSTDGGTTWTVASGGLYLGAADERPIEVELALKGGTHYAIRFTLSNISDPEAPGPYPEFTTLPVTPPENVAVNAPTALLSTQAVLNGKVKRSLNPNAAFNIECRYEYISDAQLKENEGNSLPAFEGATVYLCAQNPVSEPGVEKTVTAKIGCNHPTGHEEYPNYDNSCLTPATTYHTRLIAEDGAPGSVTKEGTFTTLPAVAKPVVITANDPTEVSYRSAKITGSIERPAGSDPALDVYCFAEYVNEEQFTATGFENANRLPCDQTPREEYGNMHPLTAAGPTPVSAAIGGLKSGVTYHLRLGAENGGGLATKDVANITTLSGGESSASVNPNPTMGYTTVKVSGTVTRGLGPAQTEGLAIAFEYAEVGTENWGGYPEQLSVPVKPGPLTMTHEFTGLTPNTEYQFRVDLTGEFNGYGQEVQPPPYQIGKTKPLAEPTVAFSPVTGVTANTAHFSGSVNTNTPGSLDELGKNAYKTEWEFQCVPGCPGNFGTVQGEEGSKPLSLDALGLVANTYYEAKLVAHNAFYTVESPVQAFQTPLVAPTVASAAGATDGQGGYFLEGIVNSNNTKVTSCHFEYGTTATYPNTYEAECSPSPSGPNEVQLINVDASEGEFQLGFRGQTTSKLAFNAPPSDVQAALRALSKIGSTGVDVSGTVGAYKVTFDGGPLAGANVEPIRGGNDTLAGGGGGGVSVSTETEGGITHAVSVEAHLEGLTVGSTYHFRIIAISAGGTSVTTDRIFIPTLNPKEPSCPNEKEREENSSSTLPECRAYEMVTSPFKVGYEANFGNFSEGEEPNVMYTSNAPNIAGSGEGFIGNHYIARRTPSGWETIPYRNGPSGSLLSPPNNVSAIGFYEANSYSADLLSNLAPIRKVGETFSSLYVRQPDGLYVLVGHEGENETSNTAVGEVLVGHSDDLSHSVYEGRDGPYVIWGEGLYEFIGTGNDQPIRVDVDNNGEEVTNCNVDGGGGTASQRSQGKSVSRDGRVIVYQALGCEKTATFTPHNEKNEIWARVGLQAGSQVSYDLSTSKCTRTAGDPGGACNAPADARFEGSTPSGSRVFFSTTQQLVNGDTDETRDLYACDIPAGEVAPTGRANSCSSLIQVSNAATGAEVENLVQTSADGKTVYFVARGVLADNTDALGATAKAGESNLYVWRQDEAHPAGQTTFIGTLLAENDLVSPYGVGPQITPSGRYLLFTSASRLVSTDNDTTRDVYRYDDESGELTRISTGVAGTGGNGEFEASIGGAGPGGQAGGSGSSGAISDDGTKIVFNTEEGLSPLDGNKSPDAYLWSESEPEEGHVRGHVHLISTGAAKGGSNKVVIDGSGKNIYFETPAALTPPDGNLLNDVYDARIDGGFSFAKAGCSGEACRPSPAPAPAAEKAPSSTQPGPGNPAPPKTCSKGKVLKKGKCVVKKPSKKKHGHKKSHKRANSNGGGGK